MPAKKSSQTLLPDRYALTEADKAHFAKEQALGMVPPQHPALRQTAKAVATGEVTSEYTQHTVQRLLEVAGGQQQRNKQSKKKRMLVGLAAPQIGNPVRIIVVDTKVRVDRKRSGKLECFINPEIVWRSRETEEGREGCFSTGPVWGLVRRPLAVKIRAYNPAGEQVERILEGFTARIMQHEIDHLDGVRFPERIKSDRKRHWVHVEELDSYPQHIRRWHRQCTLQQWAAFSKSGGTKA